LREERRLRVSENRVLKRIFGPKRDKVRGEWRNLHSEELKDLYWIWMKLVPSRPAHRTVTDIE
jgi:hypothetical protein